MAAPDALRSHVGATASPRHKPYSRLSSAVAPFAWPKAPRRPSDAWCSPALACRAQALGPSPTAGLARRPPRLPDSRCPGAPLVPGAAQRSHAGARPSPPRPRETGLLRQGSGCTAGCCRRRRRCRGMTRSSLKRPQPPRAAAVTQEATQPYIGFCGHTGSILGLELASVSRNAACVLTFCHNRCDSALCDALPYLGCP